MRKSSKRLIISTEAVNSFGFRVLTAGIDLSQYRQNPILLWMHIRPVGSSRDQILPLGFISDLQVNGTELSGIPNFDDTDDFALKIYNKIENGTIKMCSPGLHPKEQSEAIELMLPGQTGPTITKSLLIEVSIADIGSNPDALAVELYDAGGRLIKLSAGTANEVITSLAGAKKPAKASGTPGVEHSPETLAIMDNAVKAGKFSRGEADNLLSAGSGKEAVTALRKIVKGKPINPDRLAGVIHHSLIPLAAKSWGQLENGWGDGIRKLKEHAPDVYKAKFFEQYDRLPAERNGKPL